MNIFLMSNNKERTFFKRIFYLVILVLFICVPLRTIAYLAREFILCTNRNDTPIASYTHKDIPKRIHQVFFKVSNSSIQEKFTKGPESCRRHNPSYLYTLWNKTMVDEFIENNYPDVKQLYNSYDHWVKRVDAAKYLVLFHFGGWYIDMDLICKRSFDKLVTEAKRKDANVIVHTTGPVGISNDFFGISKHHPFLHDVINSLRHSNQQWYFLPYISTMFSTGPTFFWGRYLNYPQKKDFYIISNHSYYFDNLHGASWHSFDGVVIWYFVHNIPEYWIYLLTLMLTIIILLFFRCRKRNSSLETPEN